MYDGLANRLVPFKSKSNNEYFMNAELMKDNLINTNPGYSKDFKPGFKFRGLNDSTIFFDENHQHLTLNYRNAFISLALHYLYDEKNNQMVVKTLDEMEQKLPIKIFKLPQRYLLNIAGIYLAAGDVNKYKSIAGGIETYALNKLKSNPYDSEGNQILMDLYTNTKEYNKVVDLLSKLQNAYPDDPSIKSALQRYRVLAGQKDSNLAR
jgi:hypothetical protein